MLRAPATDRDVMKARSIGRFGPQVFLAHRVKERLEVLNKVELAAAWYVPQSLRCQPEGSDMDIGRLDLVEAHDDRHVFAGKIGRDKRLQFLPASEELKWFYIDRYFVSKEL